MHDIFFFSYDESYAEKNWQRLKSLQPSAKRIHGIKGTANAWKQAASQTQSSHFFSIDADNFVYDHFDWSQADSIPLEDTKVHVWRCRNHVNGLVYGHGAIKLWNKNQVLAATIERAVDFTCESAQGGFYIQPEIASETIFNHSEFTAWKAAFRECAKLASGNAVYYKSEPDPKTMKRLSVWMSIGTDVQFGLSCLHGARMGAVFGFENRNDKEAILNINNANFTNNLFQRYKFETPSLLQEVNSKLNQYELPFCDLSAEQSQFFKKHVHI